MRSAGSSYSDRASGSWRRSPGCGARWQSRSRSPSVWQSCPGSCSSLGNLCTTRCVALGVGARGAYTRGHSETRHGDVCLPEPAPRLRVRLRGALACKAPSAPTPSATITCADVPLGVGRWLPRYRGMHLDDERLYLLLDRYLAGAASAGDAQAVRDWLADHPDNPLLLDDLRLIRRVAAGRIPESSVDATWAKARRALEVPRQPRRSRRPLFV